MAFLKSSRHCYAKFCCYNFRNSSEPSTSDDLSQHDSTAEAPSISEFCSAQALVDQVIEVDNLVTKLLKVLRIIQMDNDNCIQQLIGEKLVEENFYMLFYALYLKWKI